MRRQPGDPLVAGSRITQGQLRGNCTWVGDDRALARSMLAPTRRSDIHADLPRLSRAVAERWAIGVTVVATVAAVLLGRSLSEVALASVAVYAAFGNVAVGSLAGLAVALGVDAALRRGIVYNTAPGWEKCSRVTASVFCARGTLLKGEPELVEIEVFDRGGRGGSTEGVLALAAGALASERNPVAVALRRAARDRGLSPEAVRNMRSHPGLGVVAVGQSGEAVSVGSRALMLERKISVAVAEQKIYELETSGRTVVLVARSGRLIGLCALQDGLRVGARASVQHLLDAKIEPVLMSADTRDTCEALGRALDIDHLRSEVHDDERSAAVQRIKDTGAVVAVLGHTPHDDDALAAGDAAVVLGAAGRERDEFAVSLVNDDVRDGALALALAHRTRAQAAWVLALCVVPAAFGALVVAIGLLPAAYAPLAQLLGTLTAVVHLRSYGKD
jgi:cation transport ATPase